MKAKYFFYLGVCLLIHYEVSRFVDSGCPIEEHDEENTQGVAVYQAGLFHRKWKLQRMPFDTTRRLPHGIKGHVMSPVKTGY